ncbi:hypothetical protein BJ123_1536 [Rhodopseudomonas thermotolerans]|uniref:Uncharacterized protein n=2 Tax=Rhodopseudomonas TaxID=1073 RepID=A0A336JYF6_9BRAD|nr:MULTISPECIES: hypothetical protein [Rhodopseudomonas]RED21158.1 hypothetical protein BJ125_1536 [Rhodopseudomonas pentothenatexigens]REF86836.1 hypothetical protein BJ123_1536 [Rhodopseudomonas thermotolerans]SSW93753.1 hypothetical protein SAMN05892882_1536 [Rhodopseudomonas pentothenatexigens]
MNASSKPGTARPVVLSAANAPIKQQAISIDTLASTINRAIEQAEDLGIPSAVQLLMMARLEVDLTEIALETRHKNSA